jgi:hypothetical protein
MHGPELRAASGVPQVKKTACGNLVPDVVAQNEDDTWQDSHEAG